MQDHEGDVRQFILLSEHWHSSYSPVSDPDIYDQVLFGLYDREGGTSGEMNVVWHRLSKKSISPPRLECYDDGWSAFASFTDVIAEMGKVDNQSITPKEFCELLTRCGFVDATPRKNPYENNDPKSPSREEMLEKSIAALIDCFNKGIFSEETAKIFEDAKKLLTVEKG